MNNCGKDIPTQDANQAGKVTESEKKFSTGYRMSAPDLPTFDLRQWKHFQEIMREDVVSLRSIVQDLVLESVQWEGERWTRETRETSRQLNAAEALFGFMSWLSTRDASISIGARHDCAVLPELVQRFLSTNNLPGVRENWHERFCFPCDYMKE